MSPFPNGQRSTSHARAPRGRNGTRALERRGEYDRRWRAWVNAPQLPFAHRQFRRGRAMPERVATYEYADLLTCGRGELFGPGNAQLPLPPMLMFDRISRISEAGGAHGKGQVVAELKVSGNPALDWFFACHFKGDPVVPGLL